MRLRQELEDERARSAAIRDEMAADTERALKQQASLLRANSERELNLALKQQSELLTSEHASAISAALAAQADRLAAAHTTELNLALKQQSELLTSEHASAVSAALAAQADRLAAAHTTELNLALKQQSELLTSEHASAVSAALAAQADRLAAAHTTELNLALKQQSELLTSEHASAISAALAAQADRLAAAHTTELNLALKQQSELLTSEHASAVSAALAAQADRIRAANARDLDLALKQQSEIIASEHAATLAAQADRIRAANTRDLDLALKQQSEIIASEHAATLAAQADRIRAANARDLDPALTQQPTAQPSSQDLDAALEQQAATLAAQHAAALKQQAAVLAAQYANAPDSSEYHANKLFVTLNELRATKAELSRLRAELSAADEELAHASSSLLAPSHSDSISSSSSSGNLARELLASLNSGPSPLHRLWDAVTSLALPLSDTSAPFFAAVATAGPEALVTTLPPLLDALVASPAPSAADPLWDAVSRCSHPLPPDEAALLAAVISAGPQALATTLPPLLDALAGALVARLAELRATETELLTVYDALEAARAQPPPPNNNTASLDELRDENIVLREQWSSAQDTIDDLTATIASLTASSSTANIELAAQVRQLMAALADLRRKPSSPSPSPSPSPASPPPPPRSPPTTALDAATAIARMVHAAHPDVDAVLDIILVFVRKLAASTLFKTGMLPASTIAVVVEAWEQLYENVAIASALPDRATLTPLVTSSLLVARSVALADAAGVADDLVAAVADSMALVAALDLVDASVGGARARLGPRPTLVRALQGARKRVKSHRDAAVRSFDSAGADDVFIVRSLVDAVDSWIRAAKPTHEPGAAAAATARPAAAVVDAVLAAI
ncbi:uncharacterized protein AMSG_11425 [Thecamonas trahens ATCC 50062]|uniref:Uncharacterized protein n=1 Tax=Thecamonas trahens ATCC 50062 TaxID=461836 RepID=A0A0L0DUD6_THETB|nr:hypothetical protein AMSG_11425 [Thecamonas trahens ATCC 50062]KNC55949.1 hypothetical protein AMSG_11425 [Thecamonas trahens ATCC 50062]|eukprot:XP_013752690.1 hypothetical protein AMSG_11425 [Thecamonas trahens ATCC 50062]